MNKNESLLLLSGWIAPSGRNANGAARPGRVKTGKAAKAG